jgi:hypothetical protein
MLGAAEYVAQVVRTQTEVSPARNKEAHFGESETEVSFSAPPFSSSSGRSSKESEDGGARARHATFASYGGCSTAVAADVMLVRARGQ